MVGRDVASSCAGGVNPPTDIATVQAFIDQIDLLLVMMVKPGFGGQIFIRERLAQIQQAAAWRPEKALSHQR
jgi:pentose-5-phosphate-3-epimerase